MAVESMQIADGVRFEFDGPLDDLARFETDAKGYFRGDLVFEGQPETRIEIELFDIIRLSQDLQGELENSESTFLATAIVMRRFSFAAIEATLRDSLPTIVATLNPPPNRPNCPNHPNG